MLGWLGHHGQKRESRPPWTEFSAARREQSAVVGVIKKSKHQKHIFSVIVLYRQGKMEGCEYSLNIGKRERKQ